MRFRPWNVFTCVGLVFNIACLVFMWNSLEKRCGEDIVGSNARRLPPEKLTAPKLNSIEKDNLLFGKYVTVMFPEFESFEHDLEGTIENLQTVTDRNLPILLVTERLLYPPIAAQGNVNVFHQIPGPEVHKANSSLENVIKTEYVLALPDSVRFTSYRQIFNMLKFHLEHPDDITALNMVGQAPKCLTSTVNLREWTLEYAEKTSDLVCDAVEGNSALLFRSKLLLKHLQYPLARPFPEAFFIQTTLRNIKVHLYDGDVLQQGKALFSDPHNKWKRTSLHHQRKQKIYREFGIKKVRHVTTGRMEWYGCTKETPRCFGTIVDDMPDFLYHGRWTPPCCLENLRQTARHVFETLEKCKVSYWLEGGSLLGAARNGDIIPWDYDVDLGIYKDDVNKCEPLKHSQRRPYVDSKNFVWQKAVEADFIRVQFSEINHLHVDIFPFYPKNGVMTKDFWFKTHRQDREFPETYLKPLTRINFVGWPALAPNNIPQFLEMKFGRGVIENSQYPQPGLLQFSGIRNRTVHF